MKWKTVFTHLAALLALSLRSAGLYRRSAGAENCTAPDTRRRRTGQERRRRPSNPLQAPPDWHGRHATEAPAPSRKLAFNNPTSVSHLLLELVVPSTLPKADLRAALACPAAGAAVPGASQRTLGRQGGGEAHWAGHPGGLGVPYALPSSSLSQVLQVYDLSSEDITDWQALVDYIALLLTDRTTATPAVTLIMRVEVGASAWPRLPYGPPSHLWGLLHTVPLLAGGDCKAAPLLLALRAWMSIFQRPPSSENR